MERLGPKALKCLLALVEIYRVLLPWQPPEGTTPAEAERTRVAVLPFASMSSDPENEYFADG